MATCDAAAYGRLLALAIAFPVCLGSLVLVLCITIHINRHRIIDHLYHKYNQHTHDVGHYERSLEVQSLSKSSFLPQLHALPDCVAPDVSTSPATKPDPYRSTSQQEDNRAPNMNPSGLQRQRGGRQHSTEQLPYSEKPRTTHRARCTTPDTPLSRKDQLAHRSRLIQDTHVRLGSLSPEPPITESPQAASHMLHDFTDSYPMSTESRKTTIERVSRGKERPVSFSRPLSKSSHQTSQHARPTSPTGSIRLIDRTSKDMEASRRVTSDAMETRLDAIFVPEWHPEGSWL